MEERVWILLLDDLGNLVDWLHGTRLVIGVHDTDKNRFISD